MHRCHHPQGVCVEAGGMTSVSEIPKVTRWQVPTARRSTQVASCRSGVFPFSYVECQFWPGALDGICSLVPQLDFGTASSLSQFIPPQFPPPPKEVERCLGSHSSLLSTSQVAYGAARSGLGLGF